MTVILVIGDTHIPDRSDKIPDKLLKIIEAGKPWDIVVFTGDFIGENIYRWFLSLGKKKYSVRGNIDYLPLPKTQVFKINDITIGIHHGDGVYPRGDTRGLTRIANQLRADILFTGHTHSPFIKYGVTKNILLINPGSLTGVWGGGGGSMKPSMMIVELFDDSLRIEHYELSTDHTKLSMRQIVVKKKNREWIL
ncbi:YfcE family phosphodiesterase [Staphylothermus hellenicus]|uniref:Phosphoesterase n=1 Tax=Staphylothermus hellenicus (strain DSM 12710 / JCM 10830 / BK20S6-10-b1 / P8) TaxID=591019 RepID=D7DC87_STAHD|nr:YfcE family phosphodiesterase [Staphylothermus hellenicus]ADI31784.1 phosphodiesterase, MJ0936 family [Staphylothermus hellenicus DSM 12710]